MEWFNLNDRGYNLVIDVMTDLTMKQLSDYVNTRLYEHLHQLWDYYQQEGDGHIYMICRQPFIKRHYFGIIQTLMSGLMKHYPTNKLHFIIYEPVTAPM